MQIRTEVPDAVRSYGPGTVEKPECHMLYNVTTMATTWNSIATRDIRLLKKTNGYCKQPSEAVHLPELSPLP